ncbi:Leucine-rich repeat-containing protein 51 [Tritrichomonas foetus]|uniref:Leucine-rich repeat-containing protein 51 n=1 Tax=Tritrichomonas foetus TaxID=1144522 RepID=A0A1J4KQ18_9EUKA|nr:Leucine-rich repeat-containing protein 51 [Tritrichomonas foetus]|eukprot:OHT11884.1 Leucine-rich repeat-containing protein 51 [Tritrichomonas foetus]
MTTPPKRQRPKESTIASAYAIVTAPAVDLSMQELREFSEMDMEQNKNKAELDRLIKRNGADRILINALRLNNNKIDAWGGFITKIRSMSPIDISKLQWLDLSFNKFTTIEPTIAKLKGLRKLHLHANLIHDIRDVQKLVELPELVDLTLHGNPIEERGRGKYRNYIIGQLPNLRSLDFTPLTERDKALASSYCKNYSLMKGVFTDEERGRNKDPK